MFTFLSIPSCQHFNPRPHSGGRRSSYHSQAKNAAEFQSRPPHGGRRSWIESEKTFRRFIHALLMEDDNRRPPLLLGQRVSIRPPHGGRL